MPIDDSAVFDQQNSPVDTKNRKGLLARLAVDERAQGQGLGRFLFEDALGLTLQLCKEDPLRFRLFVTDALHEDAATFYERFDLVRLGGEFPLRMVLDLKPLLDEANE